MAKLTRRSFFKQTSAGAVTLGALAGAPTLAAAELPNLVEDEQSLANFSQSLVAYIRDAATGEVGLMVGSREIVFHDPSLVARLLRAIP